MTTALHTFAHIGMPACAANQHGRIVAWNRAAAIYFRLSADEAIGREWHGAIATVNTSGCCALCRTRRALHSSSVAMPVAATVSIGGAHHSVTMMPVPMALGSEELIGFVVLVDEWMQARDAIGVPNLAAPSRVRQLSDGRMIDELTPREREVLACVVEGYDARGIASEVGISHATARNYVQRILSKLGARNKAEAVNVALSYNLLAG